jgi:hypothetical protein
MCRKNVLVAALWLTAISCSVTSHIGQYSEERSSIVPIVKNGSYGVLYNEEVNNRMEYIFEFSNLQVDANFKIISLLRVLYNII